MWSYNRSSFGKLDFGGKKCTDFHCDRYDTQHCSPWFFGDLPNARGFKAVDSYGVQETIGGRTNWEGKKPCWTEEKF